MNNNSQSDLLLSSATQRHIDQYLSRPSHGLLITGASGSGKTSVLNMVAVNLLGIEYRNLDSYPYILRLTPDEGKKSISINSVRQVDHFLGSSIPGKSNQAIKRLVIIDNAENLVLEAQNALLKNLEEPPLDSVFLLSSANANQLLPTVVSRLNTIHLSNPSRTVLKQHLKSLAISDIEADQAISMSGGVPGLAIALAQNKAGHRLIAASKAAREILSAKLYGRMLLVNSLAKDPKLVKEILYLLQQMARISLETANNEQSKRWQSVLSSAYIAEQQLKQNTNSKLTLTYLMLHL